MALVRSRWAALGAAVAVSLGVGGVGLTQAVSTGDKPVFVAITPCRLVDTRPGDANVGDRSAPLAANDTLDLQVTGSTGECSGIPADATAAAMNVTAIQGSAQSFLKIYPGDADTPNASNLNWGAGDPPTPNKVDVGLSTTGGVKIFNSTGTVHVAADLVGYYVDHTHDDRYYTQAETDAAVSDAISASAAAQVVAQGFLSDSAPTAPIAMVRARGVTVTTAQTATGRYEITITGTVLSPAPMTLVTAQDISSGTIECHARSLVVGASDYTATVQCTRNEVATDTSFQFVVFGRPAG